MTDRIRRTARLVGIREPSGATLEQVERRRIQLWGLTMFLLVAVSVGVVLASVWRPAAGDATATILPIGLVLASIGFGGYAIEKEIHLRRLARLLTDQQTLTTTLEGRLREMAVLLEAGKAMNSELELPAVLDTILRKALEFLDGESGSVMVLDTPDRMVTVLARGGTAAVGERTYVGSGIAGRVAATREPLLVEGRADPSDFPGLTEGEREVLSSISVPLVSRGVLFGVLNVYAGPDRRYTDYDLQAASLLAEQAAGALANARRFEIERTELERLQLAQEFGTL